MHRVGRLEIKISYLVNPLFSSFMSLQRLGLATIARNRIQMARLPTVSYYAARLEGPKLCGDMNEETKALTNKR